jgi:hypothetical protein
MLMRITVKGMLLAAMLSAFVYGQDAESSFAVPLTVSAGAMYTQRLQLSEPSASPLTAGFRLMLYPTVKLGEHWFGYAAIQERLEPYFYYDAFYPDHEMQSDIIQAFVGYKTQVGVVSLVVKAGRLSSAFGSFPVHYDDMDNPVLDQPLSYITEIPVRPDQIPCGTADLLQQAYGWVQNSCGGLPGWKGGLTPATLYAIPGAEIDAQAGRVDARLQVTSGTPAVPQAISVANQYAQATAGGGYTIRQGFRVGVSGFRGPYLDARLAPLLPMGTTIRSFDASAIGVDVQYALGRWKVSGEWQHFVFDSPNFVVSPSLNSGYADVKRILTPRFYIAGRAGWLQPGRVTDKSGVSASSFAGELQQYELAAGFWINRFQMIKASYEWMKIQGVSGTQFNVLGVQLVSNFHQLAWGFK